MKISSLQTIRERFANKGKKCPHCSGTLTIEKTDFFESEICEHCLNHAVINSIDTCCASPDIHKVKVVIAGGNIQVRNQCKTCGKVEGKSIGGLSPKERESLPEADKQAKENREDTYTQLTRSFYDRLRDLKDARFQQERAEKNSDWWKRYNAYLQSSEWRSKRELVLKRDNYRCQCCLTGIATQVHHKSYSLVDFRGREPCFDLVSVCSECHDRIHQTNNP